MSMPLCLSCGEEVDDDVLHPCPVCGGDQDKGGDDECWLCVGMGQQMVSYCGCPDRRRELGWRSAAMAPDRKTNIPATTDKS